MSAPLPLHSPDVHITRTGLLAAANSQIETAKPDAATLYRHGAVERRR
jgi:hypothetical protein